MSGFDDSFPPPSDTEPAAAPVAPPTQSEWGAPAPYVAVAAAEPEQEGHGVLWLVVAAVVALIALGAAGFAIFGVGGDDDTESYSLTAAAEEAGDATGYEYEMDITSDAMGVMHATVRADVEADRMAMQMDIAGMQAAMIMDLRNGVMYMDTEGVEGMDGQAPTRWISFDVSSLGMDEVLSGGIPDNPLGVTDLFEGAENVEDLGMDEIDGESVKHYRVTVDAAAALDEMPQLEEQLDASGAEMPDTIVYDVWVTEGNTIRRMVFEMDMLGQNVTTDMVVSDMGDIDPIELPDPADVTDMTELLGG